VLKNRSSFGHFNDGSKDIPSISGNPLCETAGTATIPENYTTRPSLRQSGCPMKHWGPNSTSCYSRLSLGTILVTRILEWIKPIGSIRLVGVLLEYTQGFADTFTTPSAHDRLCTLSTRCNSASSPGLDFTPVAEKWGVLKIRSPIGFFNDDFKVNPTISREIFGVRLLKRPKAVLGDLPRGLFQQSQIGRYVKEPSGQRRASPCLPPTWQ
jgi:hypothetical protein